MPAASSAGFPADTIEFLSDLRENNNRDWFGAHKDRYEQSIVKPALEFIQSMQQPLAKVAPLLRVEPKKMGGSLMRIYKDTRFSKDKTPYKTNVGIQFRHQHGRDVHAPGVYLHIDPDEIFVGVGTWRPPREALKRIREYIIANNLTWSKMLRNKRFTDALHMYEDRLKSNPRGYAKDHPLIDQLRQQSFIAMAPLTRAQLQSSELPRLVADLVARGKPLMTALCEALEQPW